VVHEKQRLVTDKEGDGVDNPERSTNTHTNFFLRRSIDRQAGPGVGFHLSGIVHCVCFTCLAVFPSYTGHNLRVLSCMNNK